VIVQVIVQVIVDDQRGHGNERERMRKGMRVR
jgi:hypothetical protein